MTNAQPRISVELIPRSAASLTAEMGDVADRLPWVDTINVPDLLKFDLRSWDACGVLRGLPARGDGTAYPTIPHVRAADVDPDGPLPMAEALVEHGVEEVLVVSGDDADYFTHHTYPVDAVDVIRRFRAELPHIKVYAGLDPYRNGIATEMRYLERKLSAGAAGIFTQPFFDTSYLKTWASLLPDDLEVWWGATTVTTPASVGYWRRRNLVAFPRDFELTLEWQRAFARRIIDTAGEHGQHVYLMPVRTSVLDYLDGVLWAVPGAELGPQDLEHLGRCVELAERALALGDEPFGSRLVGADGTVLFEDHNRVSGGDRTRHPELAIARWAAEHLTPEERRAATVYTSGEHCPMCAAAHGWVGLGRIVIASSTAQLTGWLRDLGAPPAAVAPLPITAVVPDAQVAGPVPELAERIRQLHARSRRSP